MTHKSRGFTLIELLVVIGIIAVISAIVLFSLQNSRERSRITAAMANLNTIRNTAELYYNEHAGSYAGFFDSGEEGDLLWQEGVVSLGPKAFGNKATAGAWAAAFDWDGDKTTTDDVFCVDSTGFADRGFRDRIIETVCTTL